MVDVGKRIKDRRNELHMSVDELAQKIHKNRATVYRYEKGEIANMPLEVLTPLSKALDTTPQYLLGFETGEIIGSEAIEELDRLSDKYTKIWYESIGETPLTDEENKKLIEYAKFLIYLRGEKQ